MTLRNSIALASVAAVAVALPLAAEAQPANPYWEGFYAGLNAGGLFNQSSSAINENGTTGGFTGTGSGFVGGAQAGYNYLMGPLLLGGEIDFQGSTQTTNVTGGAGPSAISAQEAVPWFATFRARVGYPVGSVMPYVTGGAVWGHQTLNGFDSASGSFNASNNFWTYTVGGGVEGHIDDRWSAKLEYLYLGTPDTSLSTPNTTAVTAGSGVGNLIRVGLNYKFY
jgi:outer membrane immunogenic protein